MLKEYFFRQDFPQRLEAAVSGQRFTARVELVPFPLDPDSRAFSSALELLTAEDSETAPRSRGEEQVRTQEEVMETMLQGLVIIGGLTFSLAASLLIEELIFGRIVRLAFVRRPKEFSVPRSQFSVSCPSAPGRQRPDGTAGANKLRER